MDSYQLLVTYLLLFLAVGIGFILVHLLAGKFIRPFKPETEKLTIYECGEPTIGSAWIQFDLRFYVVALLFVIFDVEVAFFFPWAVVFGKANLLSRDLTDPQRVQLVRELSPPSPSADAAHENWVNQLAAGERDSGDAEQKAKLNAAVRNNREGASELAWFALWDILVFFGVLLVGFAYLWRRGDLDWVRSTAAEKMAEAGAVPPLGPANGPAVPALPTRTPAVGVGH